jgi:predicted AlkP superfamily pyrophosphatase or phosphodiesterase
MRRTILAALAALGLASAADAAPAPPAGPPKLLVVIAVDQFSANLFEEWRPRFTDGLRRLSGGVAYPSGYQSHAATETCPGHSTILTGLHPTRTGIVGNTVRDPQTGKSVYCLYDPGVKLAHDAAASPVGPGPLLGTTLGDWLKAVSPQSKVVAVSGKDRGAINLAGHNPDGVFWIADGFGFTTYVRPGEDPAQRLAPVAALNAKLSPRWTKAEWTYSHPDCRAAERTYDFNGKPYTAKLPPERWTPTADPAEIRRRLNASPAYDDMTLEAAREFLRSYRLGKGPATDVLAVSFSATDYVGHTYGARGPEMCEQMHNLDRLIGVLLKDLDALRVPYVVALTADHGGSDLAERLHEQGYPAARINGAAVLERVNQALTAALSLSAPPLAGSLQEPELAASVPAERRETVTEAAVHMLRAQPEVADAYSLTELLKTSVPKDKPADELTLKERFAESVYPGRSPDILVALQPYTVTYPARPGGTLAGHGTVWNYDRRVPILFWWPGAPSETRFLPIETVDIGPTLAGAIGLKTPEDLDGRCLPLPPRTAC